MTDPVVSVCVQTYQHGPYIRQCIESILCQETYFPFEIIIGEDESTDGTRGVCTELANQFPDKIRLFLRSRKDVIYINGKPTGRYNMLANLRAARGKYIALCEGDDFWIDPRKLDKQVKFMEENQEYALCAGNSRVINEDKPELVAYIRPDFSDCGLTTMEFEDQIRMPTSFQTSTVLYRRSMQEFPALFQRAISGDIPLFIILASKGKIFVFDEVLAGYRIHNGGITSVRKVETWTNCLGQYHMYCDLNKYFNSKYQDLFISRIDKYRKELVLALNREGFFLRSYKEFFFYFFNSNDELFKKIIFFKKNFKITIQSYLK